MSQRRRIDASDSRFDSQVVICTLIHGMVSIDLTRMRLLAIDPRKRVAIGPMAANPLHQTCFLLRYRQHQFVSGCDPRGKLNHLP